MKKIVFASVLSLLGMSTNHAQILSSWTFENSVSGVNASPAPSSGPGVATALGMTYDSNAQNSSELVKQGTDGSNNSVTNKVWTIRGLNGTNGTVGWEASAPIASQGAQFSVTTVGDAGISASFDWFPTITGEANLLIQYTTNGTTWINAPAADITLPLSANLSLVTNSGADTNSATGTYINTTLGGVWYNGITLDLAGVAGVNNDSAFGFRLVNASTGADVVQASGGGPFANSGNWSFDDVQIEESPVVAAPEPGTYALMIAGLTLLIGFQIRRRRASLPSV